MREGQQIFIDPLLICIIQVIRSSSSANRGVAALSYPVPIIITFTTKTGGTYFKAGLISTVLSCSLCLFISEAVWNHGGGRVPEDTRGGRRLLWLPVQVLYCSRKEGRRQVKSPAVFVVSTHLSPVSSIQICSIISCNWLCSQSVRARRSGCRGWPGQPGVRQGLHCGLHAGTDPLHLPGVKESPSWSRLLLWQFLLCQTMNLLACSVNHLIHVAIVYYIFLNDCPWRELYNINLKLS